MHNATYIYHNLVITMKHPHIIDTTGQIITHQNKTGTERYDLDFK